MTLEAGGRPVYMQPFSLPASASTLHRLHGHQ